MTEKKTAEEMLDKLLIERGEHPTRVKNPLYWEERQLAKDFAAQELAEYKAVIEELLPIANQRVLYMPYTPKITEQYESIIERARKLMDKP